MKLKHFLACGRARRFIHVSAGAALMLSSLAMNAADFGSDLHFLKQHTHILVLADPSGQAQVAVSPAMQGRVLTSTAQGDRGLSFGWINRALIASGRVQEHINAFGGEDRLWLGPEGGQFSIFFAKGVPFDLAHWYTPAPLDTEPFQLVSHTAETARFTRSFSLTNYSGTQFEVRVDRTVRLLDTAAAWHALGLPTQSGVDVVAYESENRLTNVGQKPWRKATGLLSLWILGQFNPSPATTIVIPYKPGPTNEFGSVVTSDYFGPVPPDRLVIRPHTIFFSGDGHYRSKIGVNPRRSRGVLGSYDATHHVLTFIQFNQPPGVTDYVNSLWKLQKHPFAGDAENSYNDGPPSPGAKPLGPFYEMESSSPAAALAPGQSLMHFHRTLHLVGPESALDVISRHVLGVSLETIRTALPRGGHP